MGRTIKSVNPATLVELAEVDAVDRNDIRGLVIQSRKAQTEWERLSYKERGAFILRARSYLLNNIDAFSETITKDNGKPLTESITAEIYPVADLMHYFAKNTYRILEERKINIGVWRLLARSSSIIYRPYGVVGIISPWNFPFSIPVGSIVMALMAGNTVLLKPSSATAHVGFKIEEMFAAANLPLNTFIHLPGTYKTGRSLLESGVDKIFFTGSTEVGREIMNKCSESLTPCNLELGGKDALIVLDDANLEHASSAAVWGSFTNAGQCCASVERIYVHKNIYDEFIKLVLEKTNRLKVGYGLEPDTDIGPLTTESQLRTVEEHVKDAMSRGGKILTGGKRPNLPGYFYEPTVITNVDNNFKCVKEETFGPVMPVMTFENDIEAVDLANDTEYGLSCYIWSKNIRRAKDIARQIDAGTVGINECIYTHALPQTPWGGVKKSGLGRTHGAIGLKEMVIPHHIHTNRCTYFKDIWWYKYDGKLFRSFKHLAKYMTGGIFSKLAALPTFINLILKKR